jgi:hypothetical protein
MSEGCAKVREGTVTLPEGECGQAPGVDVSQADQRRPDKNSTAKSEQHTRLNAGAYTHSTEDVRAPTGSLTRRHCTPAQGLTADKKEEGKRKTPPTDPKQQKTTTHISRYLHLKAAKKITISPPASVSSRPIVEEHRGYWISIEVSNSN